MMGSPPLALPDDHLPLQILQLYGRVTQVDLVNAQVSVTWSITGYTGTDNSSLFFPERFQTQAVDGIYSNYPDYPIGEHRQT